MAVFLLLTMAWIVASRLPKTPAARHLVLSSAIGGSLAVPFLVLAFGTAGLTVIAVPLLSDRRSEPDSTGSQAPVIRATASGLPVEKRRLTAVDRPAESTEAPQHVDGTRGQGATEPATAVAMSPQPKGAMPVAPRPQQLATTARLVPVRSIFTLFLIAWGCGSGLLLLRLARSWTLVRRLGHSAEPHVDARLAQLVADVGRALKMRRQPYVGVSSLVSAPLALGCRRPTIVLPVRLLGVLSEDELRDVFLHEMAHLSRHDPFMVVLQELARALYWPIVPVHAVIRELSRAREELCDNYVLAGRDALSYGETLLHLAELSHDARPLVAAVGIMQWKGELEQRIAGLLDQRRSTMTRNNRWLVCAVASLVAAIGSIASATRLNAGGSPAAVNTPKADVPKNARVSAGPTANTDEKPRRSMLVHVVGPDGRPIAGVELLRSVWTKSPSDHANRNYTTDDRGEARIDIPQGISIFRLWADLKGHVPLFAGWEEEEKPETTLPAEFTFRLRRGTTIGGVVKNSAGQPIKGVMVEVRLEHGGRKEGRIVTNGSLAYQDPRSQAVTVPVTDEQGRWTLDKVPPENDLELRLKLSHPDYISDPNYGTLQDEQGVDLKALRARMASITMKGGIVATGMVTDPNGKPVAGAVVVRGERPYWDEGSQEIRTDEQGRYRLPPLPRGELKITVVAEGWMPVLKKIMIEPGMKPVDFRLEPGKELRVRFVDRDGKPLPSVYVAIDKWHGGESLYNVRHPNVLPTKIPLNADAKGLFRWTWAPADAVSYRCSKEGGYVELKIDLTADGREQTVILPKLLRISGTVTDRSGRPVKGVNAIPVIEFRPGFLHAQRNLAKGPSDGTYAVELDRTDVSYRVRIEAPGYRTAMSDVAKAGMTDPTFDFRLEEAPSLVGCVANRAGQAMGNAKVYLATHSQCLNNWPDAERMGKWTDDQKVVTDDQGRFTLPAQFEQYVVIVVDDRGYAEIHRKPGEQPGDLVLKPWARVEGRLIHAGQPVPGVWVSFTPVRLLNDTLPHIQDSFAVKTDRDGRFVFPRVPPVKAYVRAQLSVWNEYPFTSSQTVPLEVQPGETIALNLGGEGTLVKGRVVLSGDAASKIDLHKSLNWLMRRTPGIEPPPEVQASGLSARDGWNNAWTSTREGSAFIETLHTYFVVLDADGRFQISGVPAGDYDLAFRLYEPPGDGCLVSPVGSRIIRLHVTEEAARGASLDLGEIPVSVAIGPRVGDVAPDFAATTIDGEAVTLNGLRGRHVLLDFWATWCAPCVANLDALNRFHDTLAKDKNIAIVGLNLDDDPAASRAFLDTRKLPWTQAHLGSKAARDGVLARYAISSIPTYILIAPNGKLVYRGDDLEEITRIIRGATSAGDRANEGQEEKRHGGKKTRTADAVARSNR
jgi:beta-lactamase regulating signal transducer with metallopeptidase domain/thiol-disulfide isomerase/thioredoxin